MSYMRKFAYINWLGSWGEGGGGFYSPWYLLPKLENIAENQVHVGCSCWFDVGLS